nr:BMP family ABC transporter substrate-binding protein [Salinibacterium sp.]
MNTISRKRVLGTLGILGAAALTLSACAAAPEGDDNANGDAGSDFLACMVSDEGGFDDKSFNELSYNGLLQAEEELGIEIRESESSSEADYEPNLEGMVDAGCGIIVPVGFKLADATQAVADANPEVNFAIVDVDYLSGDNIKQLNYDTAQAAFLAGYAAAGYSTSKVVATYGGAEIPSVTIFMDGFKAGVEQWNEAKGDSVTVLPFDYVGDFTDQVRAQQITEGFLSQNADVILPVGGPLYQGGAEAILDAGADAVILGVDSDLAVADEKYKDLIFVSIMKGLDVTVFDSIKQAFDGEFEADVYTGTLENEGVGLSSFYDFEGELPEGMMDELDALKQQIIDGELSGFSEFSPK